MATPSYLGPGQPAADNGGGLQGRLASFFGGGGTPQYLGDGQPSLSLGYLTGLTPAYKPAPVVAAPKEQIEDAEARDLCGSCPIDPDALAAGNIAIVIPRQGL